MQTITPIKRRRAKRAGEPEKATAVVETDEHERIEIEGCSKEEVEAKLRDLRAWAS